MANVKILEPVLLSALTRQEIDTSNVELWHDFASRSLGKEYSPYARCYCDMVSGKKFAVISGLPGCDAYGQPHDFAWRDNNGVIENGNNIFHSVIDKGTTRILALSDQPNGAKKDDEVNFHPQLFIDGVEILPLSDTPRLLETDPINENYHNNVLEWDYGVCLRRVRMIEGRFLGSWVFLTNPKGDVLIKYNQSGKMKLRLQYAKDEDAEFIPKSFFDGTEKYPTTVLDSATFYPDANPETTSVDGFVEQYYADSGDTWTNIRNGAGNIADDASPIIYLTFFWAHSVSNQWRLLRRIITVFPTSSLPDDCTISAATLSIYGYPANPDELGIAPDINIYSSAPANDTTLDVGDYDSLGTTAFSTAITYAGWNAAGYNNFVLNASGIANISKTAPSRFGIRNANYDAIDSAPAWASLGTSALAGYTAEQGTGYQPKLVVTYGAGVTEKSSAETGAGAEAKTSGNPIVVTSRNETGSGAEAVLKSGAFISGDAGFGSEMSRMLKEAVSGDGGTGYDARKSLVKPGDTGSDMRLSKSLGQAGMPSRQVRMPNKGVNI